ncbi:oxygenase MpaB family protein [Mycobacterium sp. C31M]
MTANLERTATSDASAFKPKLPIRDELITKEVWTGTHRQLREMVSDPRHGLFGPDSWTWKMISPMPAIVQMLYQGGLREIPIAEIMMGTMGSVVVKDYSGRMARNYDAFMSWYCGDLDAALKMASRINGYHSQVGGMAPYKCGHMKQGQAFRAVEKQLMIKTVATMIFPLKEFYEAMYEPLTPEQCEEYYEEAKTFAMLFGIERDDMPADWVAWEAWWQDRLESDEFEITVDVQRQLPFPQMNGEHSDRPFLMRKFEDWMMAFELNMLPDVTRRKYEPFTKWAKRRPRYTAAVIRLLRAMHYRLPAGLVTPPRLREAQRRCGVAGKELRFERWLAGKLRHPFGEAMPTLTTPMGPEYAPHNSPALKMRPI